METILLIWLPMCFLVAWVAGQKGRSGVGFFFLSLFLTPLIGLLVLIAVPALAPRTPPSDYIICWSCKRPRPNDGLWCRRCSATPSAPAPSIEPTTKTCPSCAESIQAAAIKCRYCGADQAGAAARPSDAPLAAVVSGTCPGCGKLRGRNVAKCIYCGDTRDVA